jgi:hypothetical protein
MKFWCGFLLAIMYGVALATDHHIDPPDKIARLYNGWIGKHSSALIDQWGPKEHVALTQRVGRVARLLGIHPTRR